MRLPSRYKHEGEVQFLVSVPNQDDPLTYRDAMDAMNQEMESMYSNFVWELVDPPEDVRP